MNQNNSIIMSIRSVFVMLVASSGWNVCLGAHAVDVADGACVVVM